MLQIAMRCKTKMDQMLILRSILRIAHLLRGHPSEWAKQIAISCHQHIYILASVFIRGVKKGVIEKLENLYEEGW